MKKTLLAIAALAAAGAAHASPVQWTVGSGGNGHWYDFVSSATSWTNANNAANAATYFDGTNTLNGYLATITSSGENSFVGSVGSGWLGGSDAGHEGDWRWVGGPEAGITFWLSGVTVTYSSWNGGEPNNAGVENYLDYQGGAWNDLPDAPIRGYIIEFSQAADAVPEPGMLGLLGLGLGAVAYARRRK